MSRFRWNVACVTTLASISCTGSTSGSAEFPLTARVLEAVRDVRPYRLRLDDSQRHVTCAPLDTTHLIPAASCASLSANALRRLAKLAPPIGEAVRTKPTTDALWAAALLELSSGSADGRQLDRAISRLAEVRARDSTLALAANHHAVAYFARASVRGDARDIYAALEAIEGAWERDSTSHAIAFNRPFIHALLGTNRVARAGWAEYLQAERNRGWHDEAQERLATLALTRSDSSPVITIEGIRRDPQRAREFVLDSLLPAWAHAALKKDASAMRDAVNRVRTIGSELLALTGDSSTWHLWRSIEGASPEVAGGVMQLVRGTGHYRATAYGLATDTLSDAVERLASTGAESLGDWARLMLGASYMAQQQLDIATRIQVDVTARANRRGDRALEARSLWAGGIAVGRSGSLDDAERMFGRSHELFASIGEHRNAAAMLTGMADIQGLTGRSLEAANSAFLATISNVRAGGAVRYEELLVTAQQMGIQGYHRAAAHLLREAVLSGSEGNRPKDVPESLGRLSLAQMATGKRDLALSTIARARAGATHVNDAAMRARLDAELHRAEAQVVAARDPARATAHVDSARRYFATIPSDDGPLLLHRAQLALDTGDSARAQRDLGEAIRTMRGLAPSVPPALTRQLVATLRDAHRTLIELTLARGDTSRALWQTIALPSVGPRGVGATPPRPVPAGYAELRFVVMPNKVLSWARVGSRHSLAEAAVQRNHLRSSIARFINLVRWGEDTLQMRVLGNQLYRWLIGTHEHTLDGVHTIDIYNDGVLTDVPFAGLTDDRGRYIVERFAIRNVVPAGRYRTPVAAKIASRGPLLIGNPAWKRSDFPGLEQLRWADEEVRQIAAVYPKHTLLADDDATKQALLEALPRHEVVHFAGHSRIVVENPDASHIVLAAGKTFADGVLYASEIAKLNLTGVKLVVLSSCGRTRDDASSMGEVNGLAMAFLDAGVERVVAGLWEVDDQRTAKFATALHKLLAQERTLDSALQEALTLAMQAHRTVTKGTTDFTTLVLYVNE